MRLAALVLVVALAGCDATPPFAPPPAADSIPGVLVRELTRSQLREAGLDYGLVVVEVGPPADRSAIRPGDVVVAVGRRPVRSVEEFNYLVENANGPIALELRRGRLELVVPLAPGPRTRPTGTLLRT